MGECNFGLLPRAAIVKYTNILINVLNYVNFVSCIMVNYYFFLDHLDVYIFNLKLAELPKVQKGANARLPLRCATNYEALLLKFTKTEILS